MIYHFVIMSVHLYFLNKLNFRNNTMNEEIKNRVKKIYEKNDINFDDIDFMIENNCLEYYKELIRGNNETL